MKKILLGFRVGYDRGLFSWLLMVAIAGVISGCGRAGQVEFPMGFETTPMPLPTETNQGASLVLGFLPEMYELSMSNPLGLLGHFQDPFSQVKRVSSQNRYFSFGILSAETEVFRRPMPPQDWYKICSVSEGVFQNQSQNCLRMNDFVATRIGVLFRNDPTQPEGQRLHLENGMPSTFDAVYRSVTYYLLNSRAPLVDNQRYALEVNLDRMLFDRYSVLPSSRGRVRYGVFDAVSTDSLPAETLPNDRPSTFQAFVLRNGLLLTFHKNISFNSVLLFLMKNNIQICSYRDRTSPEAPLVIDEESCSGISQADMARLDARDPQRGPKALPAGWVLLRSTLNPPEGDVFGHMFVLHQNFLPEGLFTTTDDVATRYVLRMKTALGDGRFSFFTHNLRSIPTPIDESSFYQVPLVQVP